MSEEMIVRHCAPTLAGMKTGSMFTCAYTSEEQMRESLRRFNRLLGRKGLRVLPLRYRNGKALIYVFRPTKLSGDLKHTIADRLLRERGYCFETPQHCILQLMQKLGEEDFPHEIGLFLGYPPEDVRGFIENHDACKCVGCWKVYGDENAARKLFAKYKKCTAVYSERLKKGASIERLAVAG